MKLKELMEVVDDGTRVDVFNMDGIGGGATLALVDWGCTAGNLGDDFYLEDYEVERVELDHRARCMQVYVRELEWRRESYWESGKRHYRVNFELYAFAKADSEEDAEEQARHMLALFDVAEYDTMVEEVY